MGKQPTFNFKELDHEGLETLDVISDANKLNNWMYDTIKPYSFGKILEIGSGIGNISNFYIQNGYDTTLSDIRENYCNVLRDKFDMIPNFKGVINLDLVAADFDSRYKRILSSFNTVFALNVVEHIEDDQLAVKNATKLLKTGGNLIILVPAYQFLYNEFDKELFHFRRYNRSMLNNLFISENLQVLKSFYFNAAGIAGWFVSGKLMGNKTLPKDQVSFYNKLVPLFKLIDKLLLNKIGLSVISVGKKNF